MSPSSHRGRGRGFGYSSGFLSPHFPSQKSHLPDDDDFDEDDSSQSAHSPLASLSHFDTRYNLHRPYDTTRVQKVKPHKKQADWEFSDLPSFQTLVQSARLPQMPIEQQMSPSTPVQQPHLLQQIQRVEQRVCNIEAKVDHIFEQLYLLNLNLTQRATQQPAVETEAVPTTATRARAPTPTIQTPILTIQNDVSLLQCINIKVKAKNKSLMPLQAMVDIGATLSIVNINLFAANLTTPCPAMPIQYSNGQQSSINRYIKLHTQLYREQSFLFKFYLANIPYTMVIDMDILSQFYPFTFESEHIVFTYNNFPIRIYKIYVSRCFAFLLCSQMCRSLQ